MKNTILSIVAGLTIGAPLCVCMVNCASNGIMPDYSDGFRVGTVVQATKKGIKFKSYEIEIAPNEFAIGRAGSELFKCSTLDEDVGIKLESLIGRRVKVHYRQYLFNPITQDTTYTVVAVELAD